MKNQISVLWARVSHPFYRPLPYGNVYMPFQLDLGGCIFFENAVFAPKTTFFGFR